MLPMLAGIGGPGGGSGGLQMASAATSALSDRSPINIAPVAFNWGAMLQNMNQGSPENGGAGMDFMTRYAENVQGRNAGQVGSKSILPLVLIAGGALVGVLWLVGR